ncbi:MAG TPA: NAD-dependent epimerase/dehydratase family protein [Chthonomonas sp.]|jgi:nucleoside-diphosphate-sugar epimerase|uniref:NAD-dependent epimerase/dehydratase family protein n=1 Tax=Chthonomonas sp. TaxID=2282153 RepID=UPI002B4B5E7C|nr:NAD-dependent epimerase/dehydratase family protein [Chthonomonas sp.]HLH79917.1 NAD-dependent epimerase/dehydratase family protein [Chthonomonas sp.]
MTTNDSYTGATVLVTGGAGCIGSNLVRALVERGAARIVALDNLSSASRWNVPDHPAVRFVQGSILDDETLRMVFADRPDYVFHLAALFANQNSVEHPEQDLLVNGLGTLKVLQFAHLARVRRFVYASSGCSVYGSQAPLPLKEDFVSLNLDTPYQITKLLGELYSNFFCGYYGLPVVRTRFFNVYGPGEIPGRYRNVIPNFLYWAMRKEPLPITGTGEETRDFTYVDDVVRGLLAAGVAEAAVGEAVNLASGREVTVNYLANLINELTGNPAGVRYVSRRPWDRITRRCASVEKAERLLGYRPSVDFETGLRRTWEWFKANWDRINRDARF